MKACYMITPTGVEVRITSANFTKYMTIRHSTSVIYTGPRYHDEFDYQLLRRMRELVRDELLRKYGVNYRKVESKHQNYINKSFVSCAKRAKQISIFRPH